MHGQLTVDPAQLRGWADQVGRASDDCAYLESYAATYVPDGDFGWLLDVIKGDYEDVALVLRDQLAVASTRLDVTCEALHGAARRFEEADAMAVVGLGMTPSGELATAAPGFVDVAPSRPPEPTCAPVVLPTVSLHQVDLVCSMVAKLGGPDVRREFTELLCGDLDKAMRQADAWERAGVALAGIQDNLAHGSSRASYSWEGQAASAAHGYVGSWTVALARRSEVMRLLADHVRDLVTRAVDLAQLAFDTLMVVAAAVAAGWTFACVPIFGPLRAARTLREICLMLLDIKKVYALFKAVLTWVQNSLLTVMHDLRAESLPAVPALPGAVA